MWLKDGGVNTAMYGSDPFDAIVLADLVGNELGVRDHVSRVVRGHMLEVRDEAALLVEQAKVLSDHFVVERDDEGRGKLLRDLARRESCEPVVAADDVRSLE